MKPEPARDVPSGPGDDLRAVVAALETFDAPDLAQAAVRQRILDFVAAHPDALHRSCHEGHLTASALVVDPSTEQVLVLFHTKLQKWLQPGGHVDGDSDLAAGALREATEETGIAGLQVLVPPVDLDIHEVRPPAEHPHLHLDVRFAVVAPPGASPVGNHESQALRWVGVDELPGLGADPGLVRLAEAGLAAVRARR
jgi:8-oxo-dGTP pyrophosphatase MutT (NUDIX family)